MELVKLVKFNLLLQYNNTFDGNIKKRRNKIATIIFMILAILIPIELAILNLYPILEKLHKEEMLINFILIAELLILSIVILIRVVNTFFLESGVFDLWVYPIKSGNLILSKCILAYIQGGILAILGMIPLITYGILSSAKIYYYIDVIIFSIIAPMIPVILLVNISILFIILFSIKKINVGKKYIGYFLGVQFFNTILLYIVVKLNISNSFKYLLRNIFLSLEFKQVLNILMLCIFIMINLLLFYTCIGKIYLKIIMSEALLFKKSKEIVDEKYRYKFYKRGKIFSAIIRDIKNMIRTPIVAVNCLSTSIVFFIIITPVILNIADIIKQSDIFIIFLVSMLSLTMASINYTGLFSFSREGDSLVYLKVFPMKIESLLISKIIITLLSNILNFITINILIFNVSSNMGDVVLLNIVAISAILAISIANIKLDVKSINLKWVNIKELFDDYSKMFIIFIPLIKITFINTVILLLVQYTAIPNYKKYIVLTIFIVINFICIFRDYKYIKKRLSYDNLIE